MGFRFRKRISLGKFLHFNLSKSGASTSIGQPGATVNIGKRGVASTVGIPGSGLSYRFGPKRKQAAAPVSRRTPAPYPPTKGRRLLEIIDELKALPPLDNEHDPMPGLQRRLELLAEGIELLHEIQAIRPADPIERVRKTLQALQEWNRWTQIRCAGGNEETAQAEESAAADFEASRLTDGQWQEFWRAIRPLQKQPKQPKRPRIKSTNLGCLNLILVPLVVAAGLYLLG
jgi:hypothetical protein